MKIHLPQGGGFRGHCQYNYVCPECRKAKRSWGGATCPDCGRNMMCIGYRRKVPKKTNDTIWKVLQDEADGTVRNKPMQGPSPVRGKSPKPAELNRKEKLRKAFTKKNNYIE